MIQTWSNRHEATRQRGVALVIVLAFVVLLTGLIVAYFARSATSRQLSNSSAGQTKSAMLAQSASDIVIAGFRQEIAAGSSPTPAAVSYPYYVPSAPVNMVPVRFGTPPPAGVPPVEAIPNLVRRSVRGDKPVVGATAPIPTPAVPSLASEVNSASDAALNGRAISATRWNSHYLIKRAASANDTDSTPDTSLNFTAPDWVLMTRGGPEARAAADGMGTGALAINNPTPDNQHYVIGRYAYAVYDEGGLLDMNVAGHPTPATPAAGTGFTTTQVGRKGSLAMADLTQLPAPTSANPGAMLTQQAVDSIVGWRNFAAANPGGSYPNFTFNANQAANWFTYFASNSNNTGFLKAYGGPVGSTGATDQALLSRQQLLRLRSSIGFSANVLQYMGTFSRGLEQPSYIPAHIQYPANNPSGAQEAPNINALSPLPPPPTSAVKTYLGNNDAAGSVGGVAGQDLINPAVLTVRVASAFNRSDSSRTPAVIGEPLVKRKFALSRLGEIYYAATDTTASKDLNFTPPANNPTAKNHILEWFGLSRTNNYDPWTYNHGGVNPNGSVYILTLSQVAALSGSAAREPDFAELLKASINAGSLAKGGANLHSDQGNYQYTVDVSVDYNVLQIMANLIDQSDADDFPTVIQIKNANTTGSIWRTFRGVENLPYFYRYHPMSVVTAAPSPLLFKKNAVVAGNTVAWHNVGEAAGTAAFKTTNDCMPGVVTDGGKVVFLYVPDVWNPHDASTTLTNPSGPRPSKFRLAVVTQDPVAQTPVWSPGVIPRADGDWYDDIPQKTSIPITYQSLPTESTTAFTFSDDGGKLFHEPTLLWRADAPTNVSLVPENATAGPYRDINSNVPYYGVMIGQAVASYTGTVNQGAYYSVPPSANGQYIFQTNHLDIDYDTKRPAGAYAQYTFRLQYQDPNGSGNWITYDEKYPDFHGLYAPTTIVNKADYLYASDNSTTITNRWQNVYSTNQFNGCSTDYDPRVPRFGIGTVDALDRAGAPMLEPAAVNNYSTNDALHNAQFLASKFTAMVSQRPLLDRGNEPHYSTPGMASDDLGGNNLQQRFFTGNGWNASANYPGKDAWPLMYDGVLFGQNNPNVDIASRDDKSTAHLYYEDPDGMARRAMGAYVGNYTGAYSAAVTKTLPTSKSSTASQNLEGQPLATANDYSSGSAGTPTSQSLSRPMILNRAFRSIAEMSYASRGGPWKQIDFFTPESGDVGLLDMFCVNEPSVDSLAAGKVNLNGHQAWVFNAIVAGAGRDELNGLSGAKSWALPPLTNAEAANVTKTLMGITSDTTNVWRGPLTNLSQLVGHYVPVTPTSSSLSDFYTFLEPVSSKNYSYAGMSAALDYSVYINNGTPANYKIQRMRESAIRALADSGQTRVWNLMIDMVAQTGRYAPSASSLPQFAVDGETRCWVHLAIDRYTGNVIDRQIETVNE